MRRILVVDRRLAVLVAAATLTASCESLPRIPPRLLDCRTHGCPPGADCVEGEARSREERVEGRTPWVCVVPPAPPATVPPASPAPPSPAPPPTTVPPEPRCAESPRDAPWCARTNGVPPCWQTSSARANLCTFVCAHIEGLDGRRDQVLGDMVDCGLIQPPPTSPTAPPSAPPTPIPPTPVPCVQPARPADCWTCEERVAYELARKRDSGTSNFVEVKGFPDHIRENDPKGGLWVSRRSVGGEPPCSWYGTGPRPSERAERDKHGNIKRTDGLCPERVPCPSPAPSAPPSTPPSPPPTGESDVAKIAAFHYDTAGGGCKIAGQPFVVPSGCKQAHFTLTPKSTQDTNGDGRVDGKDDARQHGSDLTWTWNGAPFDLRAGLDIGCAVLRMGDVEDAFPFNIDAHPKQGQGCEGDLGAILVDPAGVTHTWRGRLRVLR